MIFIDFSEVSVGKALKNLLKEVTNNDSNLTPLIRHEVLNSIKWINKKYGYDYGEIIIACDSRKYWRKDIFPNYKGHRKNDRDKSKIDWDKLFTITNTIKQELIDHFPFKVIEVPKCECDDVVGVLTKYITNNPDYNVQDGLIESNQPILICSSDNDFRQLNYPNVQQFSVHQKGMIERVTDVELLLLEKSIRGEASDGIPNVLSDDDSLLNKKRQKSIYQTWIDPILEFRTIPNDIKEKVERNRTLIDFERIPKEISDSIIQSFLESKANGNSSSLVAYFMDRRLMQHLDNIYDFLPRQINKHIN